MFDDQNTRDDRIASLASRLRKNLLSAEEFAGELSTFNRREQAALVQYLDRLEERPAEVLQ